MAYILYTCGVALSERKHSTQGKCEPPLRCTNPQPPGASVYKPTTRQSAHLGKIRCSWTRQVNQTVLVLLKALQRSGNTRSSDRLASRWGTPGGRSRCSPP